MRAIPALVVAIATVTLGSPAGAQTRETGPPPSTDRPDTSRTTTGAAPTEQNRAPAPTGHRQPNAAQVPNETPGVTQFDRDIDRNLQICRGC